MSALFKVLQDAATTAGAALAKIVSGDSVSGKNGLLAFGFRDSSGNAVLPQLSATGAIPVTSEDTGTEIHGFASYSLTAKNAFEEALASAPLTASKVYSVHFIGASSFNDMEWEIRHFNGTTESVLYGWKTGAGHYNYDGKPACEEVTAVGGTDEIRIYAKQLDGALETVPASFCLLEKA